MNDKYDCQLLLYKLQSRSSGVKNKQTNKHSSNANLFSQKFYINFAISLSDNLHRTLYSQKLESASPALEFINKYSIHF